MEGALERKRPAPSEKSRLPRFFRPSLWDATGTAGQFLQTAMKLLRIWNLIRVHGKGSFKYENVRIGWNSRLDTIQAAVMLPKLQAFQEYELERVNEAAARYTQELKNIVKTPVIPEHFYSSWAQYTIQLENGEEGTGFRAS